MQEYIFKLKKAAKKSGGDRYTCIRPTMDWDVYFPQAISRKTGMVAEELYVTVKTTKES